AAHEHSPSLFVRCDRRPERGQLAVHLAADCIEPPRRAQGEPQHVLGRAIEIEARERVVAVHRPRTLWFPDVADVERTPDGAVVTIPLTRPAVLNALNRPVHAGLYAALERAQDPTIRAVIITGAGRGFCVGQDLQEFSSGAGDVADNLRRNYHRNILAIRALEKPVIAAVNGPAAGAGLSLALACDIRLAADSATFVPAFINIGLVPDSGGTWFAHRVLGTTRAFEWLTTGRRLPADEAR